MLKHSFVNKRKKQENHVHRHCLICFEIHCCQRHHASHERIEQMHSKCDPVLASDFAECYIEMCPTPATQCNNGFKGVTGKDHTVEIFSLLGGICSSSSTNEPHKSCLTNGEVTISYPTKKQVLATLGRHFHHKFLSVILIIGVRVKVVSLQTCAQNNSRMTRGNHHLNKIIWRINDTEELWDGHNRISVVVHFELAQMDLDFVLIAQERQLGLDNRCKSDGWIADEFGKSFHSWQQSQLRKHYSKHTRIVLEQFLQVWQHEGSMKPHAPGPRGM